MSCACTYLLVLRPPVPARGTYHPPPLSSNSTIIVVVRTIELRAPYVDDLPEALEEDAFDTLVELRNPVLEVSVAFQVELIDLQRRISSSAIYSYS